MSNHSIYLEALAAFDSPATVREIHAKAVEIFGPQVRGDASSARHSLDRYVARGKIEKHGTKYLTGGGGVDPLADAISKLRVSEARNRQLEAEVRELQKNVASLQHDLNRA